MSEIVWSVNDEDGFVIAYFFERISALNYVRQARKECRANHLKIVKKRVNIELIERCEE